MQINIFLVAVLILETCVLFRQTWVCPGSDVTPEAGPGGPLRGRDHGGEEAVVQPNGVLLCVPPEARRRGSAHQTHVSVSTGLPVAS